MDVASTKYPRPHFMTQSSGRPPNDVVCRRCSHVLGIDYGRRLELLHGDVLVGLITTRLGGRCPNCFLFYEWVPCK